MKTLKSKYATPRVAALAAALAAGSAMPMLAEANTAANTTIRNSVTVSFADAANTAQTPVTTQVDVTVSLVKAAPTLAQVTADASIAPDQTQVYTYALTANANGPDSYTVNTSLTLDETPASGLTVTGSPVLLGATTVATPGTIAASGNTSIVVPSDLVAGTEVNGIQGGDTVVINGGVFVVASVTDNGPVPALPGGPIPTSLITVTGNGTATAITAGMLVAERGSFDIEVNPGTYTGPGNKLITNNTTANVTGTPALVSGTVTTTTTVNGVTLTVTKFVRNVTAPIVGGGTTVTVGGGTYYTTGISGAPGNVLEYLIRVENAVGNSAANDVVIADAIPAFTALVPGTLAVGNNAGVFTPATDVVDDNNPGEVNGGTVNLYPGTGGNDIATGGGNPAGDGGSIAGGEVAYGRFSVTIQ